jgi:hypothetical protein
MRIIPVAVVIQDHSNIKMAKSMKHPEQQDDEVFLSNHADGWDAKCVNRHWETVRQGNIAYKKMGLFQTKG